MIELFTSKTYIDPNLFRLVVANGLFENVDGAVNVFFMGVHGYQSRNLRTKTPVRESFTSRLHAKGVCD